MKYVRRIIEWDERYSVGVGELDRQHKDLIGITNNLAQRSLCDADKGRPHFMKTVHALTVFARDHFPLEEELQEQVDYPGLEEHRRQHSEFIKQLFLLVKNFENDEETVTAELVKYLDRWIQEHVITADQKYVVYIRSKNIGLKA